MLTRVIQSSVVVALVGLIGSPGMVFAQEKPVADTLYLGSIVTVDDKHPTAEAVAVQAGKIIAVGKKDDVLKVTNASTKVIELGKGTLVPGFIDSHGHFANVGFQRAVANLLPPPDGKGDSIKSLQSLLKEWMASPAAKRIVGGKLAVGFGFDDAQLKDGRFPTRHDLDAVSKEIPIVIVHQSGHLGVANTKALEFARITAESKDPLGGVIRRESDGKTPNGVLEEVAWFMALFGEAIPLISEGNERHFIEQGQEAYVEYGFTTAQEGRAAASNVKGLASAAADGVLKIDVVAYPDPFMVKNVFELRAHSPEYKSHYRIGGIKVNLDGSPQGKTAWLTKPYKVPPAGQTPDYKGYGAFRNEQLFPVVKEAVEKKWQVIAHCNGDAACQQFIDAIKQSGTGEQIRPTRPVMVHAQMVTEDQLDQMEKIGIMPSFFSMHTYYWGDWHRDETLGEERAFRISPAASALKRKMIFTSHHDAPVALPDSIRILSSCVTRKSRSGAVIGPDQRISMAEALKALTLSGAYQYGEEKRKGSIEVGKLADFVILSQNPMTIDPDKIMDLKVLETIKEGKSVYKAK